MVTLQVRQDISQVKGRAEDTADVCSLQESREEGD
jgi:hypothetical protein